MKKLTKTVTSKYPSSAVGGRRTNISQEAFGLAISEIALKTFLSVESKVKDGSKVTV